MTRISDELRKKAKRLRDSRVSTYRNPSEYERLADRIDNEMMELPKDRDGAPIHAGDKVLDVRDEQKLSVVEIVMCAHEVLLCVTPDETIEWYVNPIYITHTSPDSWERIADELDQWRKGAAADRRIGVTVEDTISDFAERIRKLAEKED